MFLEGFYMSIKPKSFEELKKAFDDSLSQYECVCDTFNIEVDDYYKDFENELNEGQFSFMTFYNLSDIEYWINDLKMNIASFDYLDPKATSLIEPEPLCRNELI